MRCLKFEGLSLAVGVWIRFAMLCLSKAFEVVKVIAVSGRRRTLKAIRVKVVG